MPSSLWGFIAFCLGPLFKSLNRAGPGSILVTTLVYYPPEGHRSNTTTIKVNLLSYLEPDRLL